MEYDRRACFRLRPHSLLPLVVAVAARCHPRLLALERRMGRARPIGHEEEEEACS